MCSLYILKALRRSSRFRKSPPESSSLCVRVCEIHGALGVYVRRYRRCSPLIYGFFRSPLAFPAPTCAPGHSVVCKKWSITYIFVHGLQRTTPAAVWCLWCPQRALGSPAATRHRAHNHAKGEQNRLFLICPQEGSSSTRAHLRFGKANLMLRSSTPCKSPFQSQAQKQCKKGLCCINNQYIWLIV